MTPSCERVSKDFLASPGGKQQLSTMTYSDRALQLTITTQGTYPANPAQGIAGAPTSRTYEIVFHGVQAPPRSMIVRGDGFPTQNFTSPSPSIDSIRQSGGFFFDPVAKTLTLNPRVSQDLTQAGARAETIVFSAGN